MHTFRFPGTLKAGVLLFFMCSFFAISCEQTGTTTTFSGTVTDVLTKTVTGSFCYRDAF